MIGRSSAAPPQSRAMWWRSIVLWVNRMANQPPSKGEEIYGGISGCAGALAGLLVWVWLTYSYGLAGLVFGYFAALFIGLLAMVAWPLVVLTLVAALIYFFSMP